MPGVNVVVKGQQKGVSTNFSGKYELKVTKGDTIQFSFMGMNTEFRFIDENNMYNIQMNEDIQRPVTLGGVYFVRKQTYLGRKIRKIKNWFR
jgi:TonB-dependent starch-binding outer membrane protein SusC